MPQCVQRRLPAIADPLALYRALTGGAPDTALFEAPRGATLLMAQAAVRAECYGLAVRLTALSANGGSLLKALGGTAGAPLTLSFPPAETLESEERLLAPAPLHAIRALLDAAGREADEPFAAAALGVVAFDYAATLEGLPDGPQEPAGFPDFVFWVPESLLVIEAGAAPRLICTAFADADLRQADTNHHDAVARLAALVEACAEVTPAPAPRPVRQLVVAPEPDLDDAAYRTIVARLKEEIAAGEVYQIVPSRTFAAPCRDPLRAYAALREREPNSYRFYVAAPDYVLFGASPETSVRIVPDGATKRVEVRPIAGTRPRGATPDEDDRLEAEMRLDDKETAEHMMLVDLARNDVARISEHGTRRVARLLTVERYARVMHLVSSVTGTLAARFDAVDALAACLNVGTLVGAPKVRATQLLREAETTRRGPYGGAVGWLNGGGDMDTAVVIRSALVRDGVAAVRAGAGVVHDSDPQAEADETRRKASALLSILGEQGAPA